LKSKNMQGGRRSTSQPSGKKDVGLRKKPILTEEEKLTKREKARWYHIKRTYGISQDEYNEMLEAQDHKCFICQRHEDEFETKLAVDHDHKSLRVRGLLCNFCNRRILGRISDPDLLRRAAEYLELPPREWLVPKKKRNRKRKKKTSAKLTKQTEFVNEQI
jgi:hypothetical protein